MKKLLLISAAALLSMHTNAQEFDPSFDNDGWRQDTIGLDFQAYHDIAIQPDNKVVVCGNYFIDLYTQDLSAARYNVDGSLDASFGTNGKVRLLTDSEGVSDPRLALSPSGNVFITATRDYGGGLFYICKLNANGSVDNSFGTGGIIKDSILSGAQVGGEFVKDILIQPDGKILLAGYYTQSQPVTENAAIIIRYNTDGTRDNSFGTGGIVRLMGNGNVFHKLLLYPDGKILAGGASGVVPQQDWLIARFNADGTPDNSFGTGSGAQGIGMQYKEYVKDMGLQSDGSIIIGGPCGNGTVNFRIVKLTANGLNDPNFGTAVTSSTNWGYTEVELQTYTNHGVAGLAVLPDDKIVLGGGASNRFTAVRFNADGDPDNSFGNNSIADSNFSANYGYSMAATAFNAATGRFYVAGSVRDINNSIYYSNVAAFLIAAPNSVKELAETKKLAFYPNPVSGILHLESIKGNISIADISGRVLLQTTGKQVDVSQLSPGIYFINCIAEDKTAQVGQFVKY
jgi:uncharacterized delta-60 repeat protein